jgi:hypothetical protein
MVAIPAAAVNLYMCALAFVSTALVLAVTFAVVKTSISKVIALEDLSPVGTGAYPTLLAITAMSAICIVGSHNASSIAT